MAKKETERSTKKVTAKSTAYQQAYDAWNQRVGAARWQMRNWRLACLLSIVLGISLMIALVVLIERQHTFVYVAEVKPAENIVNVVPLDKAYTPTDAQIVFFISGFIHQIMSLPLDPVVARNNWLDAYAIVQGPAVHQLTDYAKKNNPLAKLGTDTKSVVIDNYNRVSHNSYEVHWHQTTYNSSGHIQQQLVYSGIFTIQEGAEPQQLQAMLKNPLGLKIVYFTLREG